MIEGIIGLVPTYGLLVVFIVVLLATLAVPLPSSMLVLASGSFAASGDLVLWQVIVTTFMAFTLGDQAAFHMARRIGPSLLERLRARRRMQATVAKCERYLSERGKLAVFASRTILSPLGPCVSYVSGASGMPAISFSAAAVPGAAVWTLAYVTLGHVFASQLTRLSNVAANLIGVVLAGSVAIASALWLRETWRAHRAQSTPG